MTEANGAPTTLVGSPIRRKEDRRFLTGRGRYVANIALPGMLHAAFVRSSEAHARVEHCDVSRAREMSGVQAVLVGPELGENVPRIVADSKNDNWQSSGWPALAPDIVRYVGECVVAIAAIDRYVAEDAAEYVEVHYAPLPPILGPEATCIEGKPPLHPDWETHYFIERHFETPEFSRAMQSSPHRVTRRLDMARHSGVPIETRGCVAQWDPGDGHLTLWSATQQPHVIRTGLADVLGLEEQQIRVISPDVGGGFGPKGLLYPEELACSLLSMQTGRPVKWIEDRAEHFVATSHAREHVHFAEVGFDDDGIIQALRVEVRQDTGAYSVYPWTAAMETGMTLGMLPGPYRIQEYSCDAYAVATNKTPFSGYRGVARPAACFTIERMVDQVARHLGLESSEVRRRNMVRAEEFPYTSVTGMEYDSGSFIESVKVAEDAVGLKDFRQEQERCRKDGRYLGVGFASFTEQTGHAAGEFARRGTPIGFGYEATTIRLMPHGQVNVYISTHNHGQGMETSFAQIAAETIGVPFDKVTVHFGDTEQIAYGFGTFASRAAVLAGGATDIAGRKMRGRILDIASHMMEIDKEDLEIADGVVQATGAPSKWLSVSDIATLAYHHAHQLPPEIDPLLEVRGLYTAGEGTGAFANATNVSVVEVHPETGQVDLLKYIVVEDCGTMINPMIVDGQVHGGVAQGIGTALYEEFLYDATGQPQSTSFVDVLLPGAPEVPNIDVIHLETPSPLTIRGIKGVGEGGAVGPGACIAAAVEDALTPLGAPFVGRIPVTPQRVHELLQGIDPS